MWRSVLRTPDIIWLCVTMCAIFESRAIYNPTHMFCDLLCLRKATYVSPQHIKGCLKICTEMAEAQFSRQNTRWPTFRYAIMLGIWMGRSLIYKQRSAKSWFHTKLILNENSDDPSGLSVPWVRERWSTRGLPEKDRKAKCALHVNEDSVVLILQSWVSVKERRRSTRGFYQERAT